ncbi:MAG TPA: DUF2877 domain-containing protein [Anaerolineae bacterium]|nr:DUF2877 domain-containing protein [Anaerolineae bacterium]
MSTVPTDWGIVTNVAMPRQRRMTESTCGELRRNVTQMGALAQQCLTPGGHGTILGVFSGVTYLHSASVDILWLGSEGTPMHRRCVRVEDSLPRLEAGAPFHVDECGLKIDANLVLDTTTASLWQPCAINTGEVMRLDDLPGRVRALASIVDCAQASGLGRFIPEIALAAPESVNVTQDSVLLRAKSLVLDAADAFRKGQGERAALCVDALVGFGAGLTPSGDDFLGGLLFGASALRTAYPKSRFLNVAVPAETYRPRTHPISWALLDDHTKGYAIAPLHVIVNGILEGASIADMRPAVHRLVRVGHSTGWDMLAGLFAGLLMADSRSGLCG